MSSNENFVRTTVRSVIQSVGVLAVGAIIALILLLSSGWKAALVAAVVTFVVLMIIGVRVWVKNMRRIATGEVFGDMAEGLTKGIDVLTRATSERKRPV